jgi:hypothetical protein
MTAIRISFPCPSPVSDVFSDVVDSQHRTSLAYSGPTSGNRHKRALADHSADVPPCVDVSAVIISGER